METGTDNFVLYMYLVAIGGAFLGLMYPTIIPQRLSARNTPRSPKPFKRLSANG